MAQKLLIISGSSRSEGDTKLWVDIIFKAFDHEIINLLDYNISHYSYLNDYPIEDRFQNIIEEVLKYDTIVFATPVYWYSMSAIMKTLFDRLTDLVTIKKEVGRRIKNKSIFLLVVGADKDMPPGFDVPFKLTSNYFGWRYNECLYISTKKEFTIDEIKKTEYIEQLHTQLK